MTRASPLASVKSQPSWRHLLLGAVRPEFRADVYVPEPTDPVLFGARCQVTGCSARGHHSASVGLSRGEYLCEPHGAMWRRDGAGDVGQWLRGTARPLRTQRVARPCGVEACARSVDQNGFCGVHQRRWRKLGRPDRREFARTAAPALATESCTVEDCRFPAVERFALCDTHTRSWKFLKATRPDLDQAGYVAHLAAARLGARPRFDLRGLPRVVALELQFVLQVRHDARTKRLTPHAFRALARWAVAVGVDSLLERSDDWWSTSAEGRFRSHASARPALALLRLARRQLRELREGAVELWELDRWPVARVDPDGRWAHQPTRYVTFSEIEPPWLKALAKRWARWRLSTATKSPRSLESFTANLRRFASWLEAEDAVPQTPAELTRGLLERFLAALATSDLGAAHRRAVIGDLKVFLDEVRMHGWEPALPANAVYLRGERPRMPRPLPRFIDEFVMGQIEAPENLARLPDLTTQTAVLILIETGLRSLDARLLPFDPVSVDEAGAPYLLFANHKLSREAVIPISQRLLEQIRRQQAHVLERWPDGRCELLLPRPKANPDGEHALSVSMLRGRLAAWLSDCEIRDATGRPVHVTPHQFRHTLGTRLINNEVPMHTVQRLLDHASPEMTARYATIKDETLRREWDRYQERINVRGEVIRLDPEGPLSDAAWAKENLARAKQTLPNGYCGLPLQQQCPHPNACLTCDHFLTTEQFLPIHIEQLERTSELIATAKTDGKERLVEMNEPVRLSLVRIIEGLESIKHSGESAESSDAA